MAEWIKSGENPKAAGTVTYGVEGAAAPAFILDSAGNLTTSGIVSSSGGSVFNVRSATYGAVANGVTDDAPAINAAIAAAAAAGGGIVYLPGGTYALAAGLVITADNIRLVGDGRGLTILKPKAGAQYDVVSTPIPAAAGNVGYIRQFLGIEQLTIDCSQMTGTVDGAGNGIHWYGVRYSYIRDVYITAAKNFSIVLDGDITNFSYNIEVSKCLMNNGAGGLLMTFSEANFIEDNEILQANVTTAANQPAFSPQFNIGFLIRCVSGYHKIEGNVIGSSGTYTSAALQVENAGPVRIIDNRFDKCRYQAIRLAAPNSLIQGNQIGSAGSAGTGVEAIRVGANTTNIFANMFDVTNGGPAYTYCIAESGGPYVGGVWAGNSCTSGTSGVFSQNAGSTNRIFGNPGYNPVGSLGVVAVPASTVAYTNHFGVDATVFITGGTVTAVAIGGTATGATSGPFRVPSGQTITLTYSVAPTWTWFGD